MPVRRVVNLDGLAETWEAIYELRKRAASGHSLLVSTVPGLPQVLGNIKNVAANAAVLKPLVQMMGEQGIINTPSLELLDPVCQKFLQLANYPKEDDVVALAHQDAWGLKRCLTLCRRKFIKAEVPKDLLSPSCIC